MAVYKIYPEKDATIYSLFPQMNTGIDEILEATTTTFGVDVNPQVSRILIKYSNNDINNVINNVIGSLENLGEVKIKNFIATAEGLNEDTSLEIYPISGSWSMGTGKYLDDPITTNGTSWIWRTLSGSSRWKVNNFTPVDFVTGSWDPTGTAGGCNWWIKDPQTSQSISISQTINYSSNKDLSSNVTSVVKAWYSASNSINNGGNEMVNEGFVIKQSNSNEFIFNEFKATELKYFSIDTNTIYPPQLEFKWRDYIFNTGSSSNIIINTKNLVATLADNPETFRSGSIYDFRINCRPKFPQRVFQTASLYTTNYYLPTASYYAVKDLDTNEFVIDFDTTYTQISADSESSYFTLYMNGLEPERYYQILIKTQVGRNTLILDDNYYFKVING